MKVAIVNDSKAAAEVLRRILTELPDFELVWTAFSGEEALRMCDTIRPDIILMDLIMPGIDGAETTRRIMQFSPCVILVVTATTVGNRDLVFEAMGYGALDAVNTPTLGLSGDLAGAEPLLQKLRTVARLVAPPRVASHQLSGYRPAYRPQLDTSRLPIVAIGASTGGPQALAKVLSHLPVNFPAAVLVAQHVDEHFAPGLVTWLQHHTALTIRIARDGEPLASRGVWLAGSKDHLVYDDEDGFLHYTPHPRGTPYRPSVDALFNSLAVPNRALRIGVLLTGMGRDGADGLLAMRNAGALTIAQDAATCVVYGMPKAAAEINAPAEVLPLPAIGPRIRDAVLASLHSVTADPKTDTRTK
jgi:two-component system response regulator WspF